MAEDPVYDGSSTMIKNPLHYDKQNGQDLDVVGHDVLYAENGCSRIC